MLEVFNSLKDLNKIKNNKVIIDNPNNLEFDNSIVKFSGKNNILYIDTSKKIVIKDSVIDFRGNNSLVFLNSNVHPYYISIDLYSNNTLYMGKDCYINGKVHAILSEEKNIFIGDNCLFSFGIWIRTADPHLIYDIKTYHRINPSKSVFIGDHVWIGQNSTLLKGSVVASGSIVGANSVVTKVVPSNVVVGGNPCKIVRKNVFWDKHVVHNYTKKETKDSLILESDEFIYKDGNFDFGKLNTNNYHEENIIGEPYFDVDFSSCLYLTDTGRCFDGYKVSVRDKIPQYQDQWTAAGLTYHSTYDIIHALTSLSLHQNLMITTHPQRWASSSAEWYKELVFQTIKNIIKRLLISLKK